VRGNILTIPIECYAVCNAPKTSVHCHITAHLRIRASGAKETKQVNEKCQNLSPRNTETPEPIFTTISKSDYIMDGTRDATSCNDR